MLSGPLGLRAIKGFRDEALGGEWKGHGSCRLNEQWRVIYTVQADKLLVQVVRVTLHDYRKRPPTIHSSRCRLRRGSTQVSGGSGRGRVNQ